MNVTCGIEIGDLSLTQPTTMKTHITQYIPLLIASFLAHEAFLSTIFYNLLLSDGITTYAMSTSVQLGVLGLFVVGISIFLPRNSWKFVFTALLVLALFQLLEFSNTTYALFIGSLEIDLIAFPLLVAHIFLNSEAFRLPERSIQEIQKEESDELEYFIRKFETKTTSELEKMDEKHLVPRAREARKLLLEKAQTSE